MRRRGTVRNAGGCARWCRSWSIWRPGWCAPPGAWNWCSAPSAPRWRSIAPCICSWRWRSTATRSSRPSRDDAARAEGGVCLAAAHIRLMRMKNPDTPRQWGECCGILAPFSFIVTNCWPGCMPFDGTRRLAPFTSRIHGHGIGDGAKRFVGVTQPGSMWPLMKMLINQWGDHLLLRLLRKGSPVGNGLGQKIDVRSVFWLQTGAGKADAPVKRGGVIDVHG
jgi:hypothetical protein